MNRPRLTASAPAKVILFGEHFVVYDKPALLAAIDKRTTAVARVLDDKGKVTVRSDIGASAERVQGGSDPTQPTGAKNVSMLDPIISAVGKVLASHHADRSVGVQVELKSKIPHGIGLGSSAASCVATVAAVDSLFGAHDKRWICDKAIEAERMIHKNSSGADCYVSTFGGIMHYSKRDGYRRIEARKPLRLIVSSTGLRHSTGNLVEQVRKFREGNIARFSSLSRQASQICADAIVAIRSGNVDELGMLMTENQRLLHEIGVSHSKTERIISLSQSAGALGAKITGAGGGGAVIVLAGSKKDSTKIVSRLKKEGYDSMEVRIDQDGLVYH